MTDPQNELQPGDCVLVIDVQNDFCPGGALAIPDGDQVIAPLNRWVAAAHAGGVRVYASRDWHPANHLSFAPQGGPWPPHCVQDTSGAAFHPCLELGQRTIVVTKGTRFDQDQYSAFDQTGLAHELKRQGVKRVWIGGLAQDVCVKASAIDAARAGFEVHLIPGASLPVTPEGGAQARAEMRAAGVRNA